MRVKNPVKTVVDLLWRKAPLEAQVIITRRCNLSCGYCTEYDDFSPPVPFEEIKTWIDALHRLRVVNTSLLGGEPLMHPQIAEIVAYSNRKNQVSITTNGFLLTKELIEKLNDAGLSNMEVSIDNLHPDRTGFIQKTFKTLRPKLELLKKHAKFDPHVNVVLCDSTRDTFRDLVSEIQSMGIMASVDLLHTADGRIGIEGPDYVKLWDEHFAKNASFTDIDYDYGRKLLMGERPKWKCRAGSRVLYVDEYGKVQYCSSQRGRLNIPVVEYTERHLREESAKYKGCEEGCSLLCVYRDSILDNAPLATIRGALKAVSQGVLSKGQTNASPATAAT